MIRVEGLTRRYGDRVAVSDLDLEVPSGSIFGLLGPNGAGKSSTLRMIAGLTRPSSGRLRVLGQHPPEAPLGFRRSVAFLPEGKALYPRMTAGEFVRYYLSYFPEADAGTALDRLRAWKVDPTTPTGDLSHGSRTRVLVTAVLARRPRLGLLDQPGEGLDPTALEDLLGELAGWTAGGDRTLVIATHRLRGVERICDRVAVLARGTVQATGRLDELREQWRRVVLPNGPDPEETREWPEVIAAERAGRATVVATSGLSDLRARLSSGGWAGMEADPMSLRDMYMAVTEGRIAS